MQVRSSVLHTPPYIMQPGDSCADSDWRRPTASKEKSGTELECLEKMKEGRGHLQEDTRNSNEEEDSKRRSQRTSNAAHMGTGAQE
ncbi:hypothetical protein NDU88_002478 [Pleurodeles waltl]|uniref:Uncharacterized protein n=1 Tax=Pleurodeles waltl TaxID=8319 RepID=A0AAV7RFP4_PLEWA|nr:hypothetical protein NDU88_002478 [Pleurodeles waltl]